MVAQFASTSLFQFGGARGWAELLSIYTTAAVFSGLSGFGFSAIGCLSLLLLPPQFGVALLMALSLVTQASSFGSLRRELARHMRPWFRRDGVMPYLAGGTTGMPVGLAVMSAFGGRQLTVGLGAMLVAYSAWSLGKPDRLRVRADEPNAGRSFLVGVAGGVVGGFSAFPGSALVVWNGLVGVGKEQGRALVQPFILWMQLVGLVLLAATRPALFDRGFVEVFLSAAPAALIGNAIGVALYRRTGDLGYRRLTLIALGVSGFGLMIKVLIA